jgi:hypothetical protein
MIDFCILTQNTPSEQGCMDDAKWKEFVNEKWYSTIEHWKSMIKSSNNVVTKPFLFTTNFRQWLLLAYQSMESDALTLVSKTPLSYRTRVQSVFENS